MRTIAVLPTAAVEQHGPHLPVGTDTLIAQGMLDRLRAACPDDLDLLILPVQAVGKSNEHLWAAGTLTLTAETALARLGRDRAFGRPRRAAQDRDRQQPWRQSRPRLDPVARTAGAGRDAGGEVPVDQLRDARRPLRPARTRLRHPWRRHGDLADARLPPRDGGHGRRARLRLHRRNRGDPARPARSAMAGSPAT